MEQAAIQLDWRDNVATALRDLAGGDAVEVSAPTGRVTVVLAVPVEFGHKFAVRAIGPGEPVVKYGTVMGVATQAIQPGEHVHVHNVVSARGGPSPAAAG